MNKITLDSAVLEQALAALVRSEVMHGQPNFDIQKKLREALAQPQPVQKPVAWLQIGLSPFHDGDVIARTTKPTKWNPEWWRFEPLYTSPQAQPLSADASPISVLLAVEESIKNGECPWQIEQAFDEYEAQRQSEITKGTT